LSFNSKPSCGKWNVWFTSEVYVLFIYILALKTGERQYFKIILLLTNKKTEQYNTTRFFYIIFLRKLPYLT
jgi:hypothetical protein